MYQPVIGLEIHLQAKTKTKMFCRCKNEPFESQPNSNTCPVCFGLPGALPVPNKAAMEACIKLALALNCSINQETKFDRKNYFYPDLPKGYQISQFDHPVGYEGYVEIEVEGDSRRIRIQRVHMEEDTAKSLHGTSGDTLIDFNKSGVPLIEMVTYPDFQSVQEVTAFAKRLRQIVRYIGASDAEMQKGQMRFELNISVRSDDLPEGKLPDYKVEVKNIGSISVLEKVIDFETKRQSELKDKGEKIANQTRGLKDMTGETLFQRSKESADDYRYFPEPDIPPIHISTSQIEELKSQMPELPHQRKARYLQLGLELEQADIFVEDRIRGDWFDSLLKLNSEKDIVKEAAKWIVGDISYHMESMKIENIGEFISAEELLQLISLLRERKISGAAAKDIISMKFSADKRSIDAIVSEENLLQISDDSEIEKFAQEVISLNPKVVEDIAKNPNAIKFLVGQVMKLSRGKANPHKAEEAIRKLLTN